MLLDSAVRALLDAARAAASCGKPAGVAGLLLANGAIQAAFAKGHGRDILRTTAEFSEPLVRIAENLTASSGRARRATNAGREMLRIIDAVTSGDDDRAASRDEDLKGMIGGDFSAASLKMQQTERQSYTSHFTQWKRDTTLDV